MQVNTVIVVLAAAVAFVSVHATAPAIAPGSVHGNGAIPGMSPLERESNATTDGTAKPKVKICGAKFSGKVFGGNDLKSGLQKPTWDDCVRECAAATECTGISYSSSTQTCDLKKGIVIKISKGGVDSMVITRKPTDFSILNRNRDAGCPVAVALEEGIAYVGTQNFFPPFSTADKEECATRCLGHGECSAFTWKEGTCHTKHSGGGLMEGTPGAWSGSKFGTSFQGSF